MMYAIVNSIPFMNQCNMAPSLKQRKGPPLSDWVVDMRVLSMY